MNLLFILLQNCTYWYSGEREVLVQILNTAHWGDCFLMLSIHQLLVLKKKDPMFKYLERNSNLVTNLSFWFTILHFNIDVQDTRYPALLDLLENP